VVALHVEARKSKRTKPKCPVRVQRGSRPGPRPRLDQSRIKRFHLPSRLVLQLQVKATASSSNPGSGVATCVRCAHADTRAFQVAHMHVFPVRWPVAVDNYTPEPRRYCRNVARPARRLPRLPGCPLLQTMAVEGGWAGGWRGLGEAQPLKRLLARSRSRPSSRPPPLE
jgi:hypothetical protein